jgi:hypothetical protein
VTRCGLDPAQGNNARAARQDNAQQRGAVVMEAQAVINRAELMAVLQGRGVGLKDGTIPNYFEADPDAQESRGRGWYYQTSAGAWIFLGGNLDDAKKTAMTASAIQGIIGKPPKALERTWVDVGIQYFTVLAIPTAVGATTGALAAFIVDFIVRRLW